MFDTFRKPAAVLAVVGSAALGGSAIATAGGSSSSASPTTQRDRAPLSSEVAAKVRAAARAEVPGATVQRTEAGGPYATPYHAHITTANGTRQVVLISSAFEATAVQADTRRGGRDGRRGARTPLSSTVAAKVKAAALAEVPGATVQRTEAGGPYGTPYHAHITTADGTRQVVLVDADFEATSVQADARGARGTRGGRGETALTGTTKTRVEAAVTAKHPGATIERTETNRGGAAPYESHITTAGGQELEVLVSEDIEVVAAR